MYYLIRMGGVAINNASRKSLDQNPLVSKCSFTDNAGIMHPKYFSFISDLRKVCIHL